MTKKINTFLFKVFVQVKLVQRKTGNVSFTFQVNFILSRSGTNTKV